MITILAPVLVIVIGAFAYLAANNTKVQEMGRLTFGAGMLVTLFLVATHVIKL